MNISLSFRQISGFNYTSNKSEISFNFYGLTTEKLVEGYEILLRLFLILGDGTMDTNPTEAKCILNESITLEGEQTQADFECNITGLNETQEYKSFKLYDSKDIAGIPEDEILLDPVKTEEAIKDGILLDYSLEENKNKFPIYFNTETILPINGTYSPEGLNINIEGNIKQEIENETKINITLTYPKNYTAECTIPKTPVGKAYIYCLLKSNISSFVIIEQQILRDGLNEFLTIASGKSAYEIEWNDHFFDNTTEFTPEEAEKKLNLGLSFRQINHFIFNPTSHFISFYFFGITTRPIIASYKIIFQLYLILSGGIRDTTLSTATCTIGQAVDPNGGQAQADFNCEIEDLDKTKEYESFELCGSEDIAGIPEDEILKNPVKTEESIKNGTLLDYSLEENKNKLPNYFTVESINGTVSEKGEFTIVGTVNQEITEENKFTLELAYPLKYKTKCIIPKTPAGKVEIVCQLGKSFSGHIMIAQQVIRKGSKELFTINSFKSVEELHWNKDELPTDDTTEEIISHEDAEKKMNASLSFRQINQFVFNPTSHFITFNFYGIV